MVKLEDIKAGSLLQGLQGSDVVSVIQATPIGLDAVTVIYKDAQGRLDEQMVFRADESRLHIAKAGRPWAFDANGEDFKLGLEAFRISQAALFDPMMAVHTSNVEPLPHQISAVYESMLPRQPLRFVLADDPGAGKTIMAGLLISELILRADAKRILIVSPGGLTEQWQDELLEKFSLTFEIFSREKQEQCTTGNFFEETDRLICRLDQLSRNEEYQAKLASTDWDLIIVDEAHKLSASYSSQRIKKTKRFELGELLGSITRHFLLMTATPHNGKEADFQIWLSLLDSDRFYGKFREGAHKVDVSDMMRRVVKEELLKFDGTPLFPERRAYTVNYILSPAEENLYAQVTDYVRNEMNRADNLGGKRKGTVGFALTQLQRRLASSPEAIYQSLKRRRKRLESRMEEMKLVERGLQSSNHVAETLGSYQVTKRLDLPENWDDLDEELTAEEYENFLEQVTDQATAAETIIELDAEIMILKGLEHQAMNVVRSGNDKKWEELSQLLQDKPEMYTQAGSRRKLIIFTEHKDTLNYLVQRIKGLLGNPEAVVTIHGGTPRDERRKVQERFRQDESVLVLVATDAAGEGVNLQNANLMVNYDLPWNPNRLEQRFGRIHRIGQTEVCHLWNLVAKGTREGDVFQKLFDKIEIERKALGGKVFDVLGEAFEDTSLKDLLVEAIRYGDLPETKAKMNQAIDNALDTERIKDVLKRNALIDQHITLEDLYAVKDEMEKAEARKLQPYFIRSFFEEAFKVLGGQLKSREAGRYEIRHVPAAIIERDRLIGEVRTPVLKSYERVCFEKNLIRMDGKPMADLIHPKHPLMAAITDLTLSTRRALLKQGAVLVDPSDEGTEAKVLFVIDHSVRESSNQDDKSNIVSRRLQFIEIDQYGHTTNAGWTPHLGLKTIDECNKNLIKDILEASWITQNLEAKALHHAAEFLVPQHYQEVKQRREKQIIKTLEAVHERLTTEINYLAGRYLKLQEEVQAGRQPRMQPENIRRRHDQLTARLAQRKSELEAMQAVVPNTPVVIGGALIIPQGLLDQRQGVNTEFTPNAQARARVESIAMQAVTQAEKALGHQVIDVSAEKCGWDLTARPPMNADKSLPLDRHIEVKGRAKGQSTITVTKNEISYALNQGDKFILAIVIVDGENYEGPFYIRNPFITEPDFGVASINYDLSDLLSRAQQPEHTL